MLPEHGQVRLYNAFLPFHVIKMSFVAISLWCLRVNMKIAELANSINPYKAPHYKLPHYDNYCLDKTFFENLQT